MYEDLINQILRKLKKRKGKISYSREKLKEKIETLVKYIPIQEMSKLVKHPEIFTLDKNTLEHRIEYLIDNFGLTAVIEAPSLLTYEPSTIEDKIKKYKKIFNRSREEIKNLIKRFPNILTYNPETVKRKIEIIALELGISYNIASKLVYENPRILSRSEGIIRYVLEKCGKIVLEKPSLFYKSKEKIEEICK